MTFKIKTINLVGFILNHLGKFIGYIIPFSGRSTYFFMPFDTLGGAELVHLDILRSLETNRIKIIIWHRKNPWIKDETFIPKSLYSEFSSIAKTSFFSNRLKFRITNWPFQFWSGYYASKINKTTNIIFVRNGDEDFKIILKQIKTKKFKLFIVTHNSFEETLKFEDLVKYMDVDIESKIDKRILISDSLSQVLDRIYIKSGINMRAPSTIIYNSITTDQDSPQKKFEKLDILYAGRDANEKRFHLIYNVAEKLIDEKNIHFHFAGPKKENYVPIKNSTFYDEILDQKIMHNLYIKTNVFLLLSKSEGFPRSIAEAMGTGSVIISTKVGSIPDHINSNNGFLIESELNEEQIVNQSVEILKQIISNKKSNELSQNSRSYALKNFSFNTFKFKYNNLLHESLS